MQKSSPIKRNLRAGTTSNEDKKGDIWPEHLRTMSNIANQKSNWKAADKIHK
jgi:hypothetical protein